MRTFVDGVIGSRDEESLSKRLTRITIPGRIKKMTNSIEIERPTDSEQWIVDRSHKHDREGVQVWQGDMLIADVLDDQHGNAEIHAQQIAADHNNAADYQTSLTRITAQRNRYWEQVEVLVEALRELEDASAGILRKWNPETGQKLERLVGTCAVNRLSQAKQEAMKTLAAVAEESES